MALVIALLVKTFVVQAFYIPSGSMENTLRIQDKVLVNKLVYRIRSIQPGDIVVFNGAGSWNAPTATRTSGDPLVRLYDVTLRPLLDSLGGLFGSEPGQTDYVKRVIGVPGDHVACCNAQGLVTINGVPLHEKSYLYPGNAPADAPQEEPGRFRLTVPAGRLWVLGDHRAVSDDSRGHEMDPGNGTIPESAVIGRAFVIAWPPSHWRVLRIPGTFLQPGIDRKSSAGGRAGGLRESSSALGSGQGGVLGVGPSVRLKPSAPYLPLGAGLAGAVPVIYLRRRFVLRGGRGGRDTDLRHRGPQASSGPGPGARLDADMNDDQSMRDLVADGHGPGDPATEFGPQPDGQAAQAAQGQPGAGQGAQDQAGAGLAEPGAGRGEHSGQDDKSEESGKAGGARARRRPFWAELVVLIVLAMTIALVIKSFVVQAFYIPSSSMETTLLIGDKVLVNKLVYHLRPIKPGDIVVFDGAGSWVAEPRPAKASSDPIVRAYDATLLPLFRSIAGLFGTAPGQTDFIKRVIGVPGDHVACCNAQGLVTVNGVPLHEKSYLYPGAAPSNIRFHVTVPPGRLWVMGDNRQVSDDSRLHGTDPGDGTIPENMVIGRAFMIVWPLQRWRILPIPSTFEQPGISKSTAAAAGAAGSAGAAGVGPAAGGLAVRAGAAAPYLPLAGGFAAALPLTWVERRLRLRAGRRAGLPAGRRRGQKQR